MAPLICWLRVLKRHVLNVCKFPHFFWSSITPRWRNLIILDSRRIGVDCRAGWKPLHGGASRLRRFTPQTDADESQTTQGPSARYAAGVRQAVQMTCSLGTKDGRFSASDAPFLSTGCRCSIWCVSDGSRLEKSGLRWSLKAAEPRQVSTLFSPSV